MAGSSARHDSFGNRGTRHGPGRQRVGIDSAGVPREGCGPPLPDPMIQTHLNPVHPHPMSSIFSRCSRSCALAFLLLLPGIRAVAQAPAEPGPEHESLKRIAGEWIATIKSDGGDSKGTMVAKMDCGGLWLSTDFRGDFGGMPFQGRGLDGYDPATRKYVSVWVDSMITKPLLFEGTMDKAKKTLTKTAEGIGMDGKPAKYKSVTHHPDDDHQVFTMFMTGADGVEQKVVTIEYVRKK